jgi:hypothetical protein
LDSMQSMARTAAQLCGILWQSLCFRPKAGGQSIDSKTTACTFARFSSKLLLASLMDPALAIFALGACTFEHEYGSMLGVWRFGSG